MKAPPVQIIALTITPRIVGDQTPIRALDRLAIEDPGIRIVRFDVETGRVTLAGVGEIHLEIIIDRLRTEFGVEGAISRPVAFLKTALSESAVGESKYVKTVRGKGQYAHLKVQLTPRHGGAGYSFENRLLEGVLPTRFLPAIEQGIETARKIGMGTGHPLDDVEVQLLDGSYHDVDSSDSAFRIAASQALFVGAIKGRPMVVEPVMRVDVALQTSLESDVLQNLRGRGARILLDRECGEIRTIAALIRVRQIFGLAADLARSTAGIGTYSMHFERYESVPIVPDELNLDDEDRDSLVGAPRKPATPNRSSAIALPEPDEDEDGDDDEWWLLRD